MLGIFGKKSAAKQKVESYDKEHLSPVIRCSICTGEQVAGFRDSRTGKFEEIMLITNDKDLDAFMARYGITEIRKEY
ncbi:MAG: aspartate dehydrogenase [Lachnospiraceae bacterium]|nr:aspartate dehydrogenase [Lachnospiraceae bacterium]